MEKTQIALYCSTDQTNDYYCLFDEDKRTTYTRERFLLDVPGRYYVYQGKMFKKKKGRFIISPTMYPDS